MPNTTTGDGEVLARVTTGGTELTIALKSERITAWLDPYAMRELGQFLVDAADRLQGEKPE